MPVVDIYLDEVAQFILTSTGPDVWSRIGEGISSAVTNGNPESKTVKYIHQRSSSTRIESYAPTLPISGECKYGDAAFDYVLNLWNTRAVGTAAETYLLTVELYKTPVSTDQYPAHKQKCSIQVDNPPGGEGTIASISYTINFIGDQTNGLYDVSAGTFA